VALVRHPTNARRQDVTAEIRPEEADVEVIIVRTPVRRSWPEAPHDRVPALHDRAEALGQAVQPRAENYYTNTYEGKPDWRGI
jgi:hypothetical protein